MVMWKKDWKGASDDICFPMPSQLTDTILTKVTNDLYVAKYSLYFSFLILFDFPLSLNTYIVMESNQQDRKVTNSCETQNKKQTRF